MSFFNCSHIGTTRQSDRQTDKDKHTHKANVAITRMCKANLQGPKKLYLTWTYCDLIDFASFDQYLPGGLSSLITSYRYLLSHSHPFLPPPIIPSPRNLYLLYSYLSVMKKHLWCSTLRLWIFLIDVTKNRICCSHVKQFFRGLMNFIPLW